MTKRQTEKIRALRDIVTEYNRTLSTTDHLQISDPEAVANVLRPVYEGSSTKNAGYLKLEA